MLKLADFSSSVRLYLILLTLFLFSVTPALAQVTFTSDEAQFAADNPDLVFQDFDGAIVSPGVGLNCIAPVSASSDDSCFSPGDILPGIAFTDDPGPDLLTLYGPNFFSNGNPGNVLVNVDSPPESFDIIFTPGVNVAGMTLGCLGNPGPCNDNIRVQVFGESGFLGEIVTPASSAFNNFLGITSGEPIVEISLDFDVPGQQLALGLLDIRFPIEPDPIPTLSEWGMIAAAAGLGLIGVVFAARRRATVKV